MGLSPFVLTFAVPTLVGMLVWWWRDRQRAGTPRTARVVSTAGAVLVVLAPWAASLHHAVLAWAAGFAVIGAGELAPRPDPGPRT